jgi:hypothetical protein
MRADGTTREEVGTMGNCDRELRPPPPPPFPDLLDATWKSIFKDMNELKILRALKDELNIELPKCGSDFYIQCNFDRLIRICPFDPAWDAFEWKHKLVSERLESLEVQVKELQAGR